MLLGALKLVILISSASLFSKIILFLSEVKIALTPVISETLFNSVDKLLKSSGRMLAETETASLRPAAIDIETVPLIVTPMGSSDTLVTASAVMPVLEAFSLNSFKVNCDDGKKRRQWILNDPQKALYIPEMIWDEQIYTSEDSILLVLANTEYDIEDYIEDYEKFKELKNDEKRR